MKHKKTDARPCMFPLIKLAKKLKVTGPTGESWPLTPGFPLIKLAKKLKETFITDVTIPDEIQFPLIKLAKKLKV